MDKKGRVYLIGAGPGDPGLITHKGMTLLKKCDVVIYDRLVSPELLNYVKEGCEKIFVGKTVGRHTMKQEEINRIIIEKALDSHIVVRLKGGDPYVFGRGGEEALSLKEHGILYEVIPGITSAIAAATYAGIPITHRGISQSFYVITGHTADEADYIPEDFKTIAKFPGTLVILMGIGNFNNIREELLANGKPLDTPVAVVSNGTTLWQKEVRGTLEDICRKVSEENIKAPAIIIVGNVAKLDMRAAAGEILSGVKVGVTGTRTIIDKLSSHLEELGARVETVSLSEVYEYENNIEFEKALHSLEQYRWIVFTSINSVHIYFSKMMKMKIDSRRLSDIKFAAVGSGTKKALWQHGFQADFVPEQYTVSNLAEQLCNFIHKEERLLIPRAEQGSDELIEVLYRNQIKYDEFKIYNTKVSTENEINLNDRMEQLDYITFASASGVHYFFRDNTINPKEWLGKTKFVCIGKATEFALKEYGYDKALIATEASAKGLIGRICEDFTGNQSQLE